MSGSASRQGRDGIRRILIIKWSAMGDVVMATALMEDVRLAFPEAELHLNTLPPFLGLFRHDPRFADVFAIDVRARGRRWRNALAWLKRVRAGRYDLIIDIQRTDHTRALLGLLRLTSRRPPLLLGNAGGFPYHRDPPRLPLDTHAFRLMRAVLQGAGIPTVTPRPHLHVGEAAEAQACRTLAENHLATGRFAVLLPGSQAAGRLKRWGVERFAALARLLLAEGLERVAIVGGPDELDDCRRIAELSGAGVVNLAGRTGILEVVPIVGAARLVIGNDTGTGHLASCADTPLVVICGPTEAGRVIPVGPQVSALQAVLPCSACYLKECNQPDRHACMRLITPEYVCAHALNRLGMDRPLPPTEAVIRQVRLELYG